MKKTIKRILVSLMVVVIMLTATPLNVFVEFEFLDFGTLFFTQTKAESGCKTVSIDFEKEYQVFLLDKETTLSGSFLYSGNDNTSSINLSFSCNDSSAFAFCVPESRVTDSMNKTEIFSLRVLAKKKGTFEVTVTTSDGFSDKITISVVDNSYDQYLASTLINQKKSSIKNTEMLYNYFFSEKLDTTDFITSFIVNEDSRFNPEYYYELVILDLLLDQAKNQNYLDSVKQNIEQAKDTIVDHAIKYNTNYTKEQLNKVQYSDLTTSEKLDYQQAFEDATSISNIWDSINSVADGIDTVEDYFNLLAKYSELENVNEYYIKILDDLSIVLSYEISETALTKPNEYYFNKALDSITAAFYDSNIVVGECLSKSADDIIWNLVKEVANACLEKILGPASQIIEITYETSLLVANSAFALSDLVVAGCTIKAVNYIEHYLKKILEMEASSYSANKNDEYAKRFNSSYILLLSCFNYGNKVHSYYESIYYNDMLLTKIGTLFNKNSKVQYSEIVEYINKCNKIIEEEYEYFSLVAEQFRSNYYGTTQKWAITLNHNSEFSFNSTQYFFDGEEIWLTGINPKRNGYDFAGWYYDSACTKEFSEGVVAEDNIVIYAKWVANAIISTDSINNVECRLSDIAFKMTRAINNIGQAEYIVPAYMDGYILTAINSNAIPEYVSSVFIPNTVTSIADSAISKNTVIYCESNSYAEQYATKNGYQVKKTTVLNDSTNPTGDCGVNLKWELDRDTGVLKIFGQGDMYNYRYSSPWKEYEDYIISVEFGDGVTSVGHSAFYELSKLKRVVIADNITNVAEYAFYNCTALESVEIGKKVEYIGNYAFGNCTNLIKINYNAVNLALSESSYSLFKNAGTKNDGIEVIVGDCVEIIPVNLFWSYYHYQKPSDVSPNIRYVSIGKNVSFIGDGAFANCSNLSRVDFHETKLEVIDEEAFVGCTSLSQITLPKSLKTICWHAFSSCDSLTSITIPDSVTSIGDGAFSYCDSLTSVTIGDSVTSIGDYAFSYCDSLTSVTIGDSVTSIGDYAFSSCNSLTSITIPGGVTSIGDYAFSSCDSLTSVTIGDSVTSIGNFAFSNCDSLTSVTIGDSVTSIGDYAFSNCANLTSITIPDSVTSIGDAAFNNCSLETVVMGSGLNHIPITLINDDYLKTFVIGSGVNSIGEDAFFNCNGLTSVTIPDSVTSIGDCAFLSCDSLTSVTIPDSVTSIGDCAFYGCGSSLKLYYTGDISNWCTISFGGSAYYCTQKIYIDGELVSGEVVIPDDVTSIGDYAFSNCANLTSITIPDSVTSIGNYAFSNCGSLTSITIPDGVTSIGEQAFGNCNNLISITIPDSVTAIGNCAFWKCTSLTSVTLPDSLTSIDDGVFCGCTILKSVTIPDSVTSIGNYAFQDCDNLTSVTIPDSVTSIGEEVFSYCNNLTSITIPDGVTSIGSYVFYGCDGIDIYFLGTEDQWNALAVEIPGGATVHYNSIECDWLGHYASAEGEITLAPTCTSDGEVLYVCTCCGVAYTEQIASLGHTTSEYEIVLEATCTVDGEKRAECTTCGEIFTQSIPSIGHSYEAIETIQPTCTQWGYTKYKCSICYSEAYFDYTVSLGHTPTSNGNIVAPSCIEEGYTEYFCSVCETNYRNNYVNALGHNFVDNVCVNCSKEIASIELNDSAKVTITAPGEIAYFSFVPEVSGTYCFFSDAQSDTYGYVYDENFNQLTSDDDSGDGNTFLVLYDFVSGEQYYLGAKYLSYSTTGEFYVVVSDTYVSSHNYISVTVEPTCEIYGYTSYTCTLCGKTYTDNYTDSISCNYELAEVIEPTCFEYGYSVYECSMCRDQYTDDYTDPQHTSYEIIEEVQPECGGEGYVTYRCSGCGEEYSEWIYLEHTKGEVVEIVEPVCGKQDGYTVYNCSNCCEEFASDWIWQEHIHGEIVEIVYPVCGKIDGYTIYNCSNCGEQYRDDYIWLEHNKKQVVKVIEPICGQEYGYTRYRCTCGTMFADDWVWKDHTGDLVETTEATCTKASYNVYCCKDCGEKYDEWNSEQLGHSLKDGICTRCDMVITEIQLNVLTDVDIETEGDIAYFMFIPEVDGTYYFYSDSDSDTYGCLYDFEMNLLSSCDDYNDVNFVLVYDLIAGQKYYVSARYYLSNRTGNFKLRVSDEFTSNHSYELIETIQVTCCREGYEHYKCNVCEQEYNANFVEPIGHNYVDGLCGNCGCNENNHMLDVKPLCGSTVVIDEENKMIYGINSGLYLYEFREDYLSVCDDIYLNSNTDVIGTGTIITFSSSSDGQVLEQYTVLVFGDVNGDGWYDGTDSIIVSCLANGMLTKEDVGEAVYMAADCNHDGVIDQLDVDLLNQAGTLLANVDQSKPAEVLLETSSEYVEYLDLIDQSPEIEVEDDTKTDVEPNGPESEEEGTFEENTEDSVQQGSAEIGFIDMIINFIKSIFEMLLAYIPIPIK